ncbi:MAG: class I SAM-dependent methyltransferase [Acidobacteriota bacterium]
MKIAESEIALHGESAFEYSGLASLDDLSSARWIRLFSHLEQFQARFLAHESRFRSAQYPWPRDPLHTWSRVWEYPYAAYHILKWRRELPRQMLPRVVDLGSGVTSFPFFLGRCGCQVVAVDADLICARDFSRAIKCFKTRHGRVDFALAQGGLLPFRNASVDCVYCISVLEHVPDPRELIDEVARVLKPGGTLVITVDISADSRSELTPQTFNVLRCAVLRSFQFCVSERVFHPSRLLTTNSSPCLPKRTTPSEFAGWALRTAANRARHRDVSGKTLTLDSILKVGRRLIMMSSPYAQPEPLVCCYGAVLTRSKSDAEQSGNRELPEHQ